MLEFIDLVLHIDAHLERVFHQVGYWLYVILFVVIFSETGLVITPFLPGDSLLFAVGALASRNIIPLEISATVIAISAILGNTVNYYIGRFVGPKIFTKEDSFFFNKRHLKSASEFYERHGSKAVVIARFLPIFRTFVPFVAGIARMNPLKFNLYNAIGSLLWTTSLVGGGYHFGNISYVKEHFSLFVIGIIILSLLPIGIKLIAHKKKKTLPVSR